MNFNIPLTSADVIILIVLLILCTFGVRALIGFFRDPNVVPVKDKDKDNGNQNFSSGSQVVLTIGGMQCGMCESHVKDAIRKAVPGAEKVTASHVKGEAVFTLHDSISRESLEEALHEGIDPLGYRLTYVAEK